MALTKREISTATIFGICLASSSEGIVPGIGFRWFCFPSSMFWPHCAKRKNMLGSMLRFIEEVVASQSDKLRLQIEGKCNSRSLWAFCSRYRRNSIYTGVTT